jgi:hypothetical protein
MPAKWNKDLKVLLALIFLPAIICLVPFLSIRWMAWPFFFLTILFFYNQFWRGPKYLWMGTLLTFVILSFMPFDVSVQDVPGPPRFIPLVTGYPSAEAEERSRRGEILLGGDLVWGNEPDWVWVW